MTAEESYLQSKQRLVEAQVAGQEYDNRLAAALAGTAEMAYEREKLRKSWDAAAPALHRIYYLTGEINGATVGNLIETLSRWDRIDNEAGEPDREYIVVISSPGGEVVSGFQAYSYMKGLSERRTLTLSAAGICASMATVLHQAASPGRRIIEPGCTYLLHEVSGHIGGRLDSVTDTAEWLKAINKNMHKILAEKSHRTEDEIERDVSRREKFLDTDEVIEWGLADSIEYVT